MVIKQPLTKCSVKRGVKGLMSKYAAFYMFAEANSSIALQRLRRLCEIYPDVTFIPVVGVRQLVYIPMFIDEYMFGSTRQVHLIGRCTHLLNSLALSTPQLFQLAYSINKQIGSITRNSSLTELRYKMEHEGFQNFHVDFTPKALFNGDHALMHWFNTVGKKLDFDYLIFYEPDIYTTKPLDEIYGEYTNSYDACFNEYGVANSSWSFCRCPPGCAQATKRWLKQRKLPTTLYRCIFGGSIISRAVFERLSELKIDFSGEPYCFAEMRLATVITALGFKCGRLNFPFYRFRPVWSEKEIYSNAEAGIFHPVKTLTSVEKEYYSMRRTEALPNVVTKALIKNEPCLS